MIGDENSAEGRGTIVSKSQNVTVVQGYSIEQHEAALERREARVRADLERVLKAEIAATEAKYKAEKIQFLLEISELKLKINEREGRQ